jgi:hypothetical protein
MMRSGPDGGAATSSGPRGIAAILTLVTSQLRPEMMPR